jgi:ATP-binding cassette, subfamily B, bacterial
MRLVWRASPPLVGGIVVLRILAAFIPLAVLTVSRRVIDDVVAAGRGGAIVDSHEVEILLAAGFGLAVAAAACMRATDYLELRLSDEFSRATSLRVMRQAGSLDLACFEDPHFYDKLDRARAQATDRVALLASLGSLTQRTVAVVALAATLVSHGPWLFVILLACVLPTFAGESHFALLGYALAHRLTPSRRELDYVRLLGTSRESAKEVKVFALSDHLQRRFEAVSADVARENQSLARRRLGWGLLLATIGTLGYYGGYAYLVIEALHGTISVGTLTFLAGALAAVHGELQTFFSLFSSLSEQALFLNDLLSFLELTPRIVSRPEALAVPRPIRKGFEFRNVSFHYPGSDKLVLEDLCFTIGPGERVALVGENGGGKTTLVKLIARLYEPTSGVILLDGKDLAEYRIEDLRREIGVIFQDFFRFDMNVRDNIAAGKIELSGDDQALWNAAKKSGADETVAALPEGLDQMLGRRFEGGVDLSGGQWQSVALARAYLRDAQLLILDEPTAALDARAEAEVFATFADLTRDRIAVLISHRFSTVRMADRILVLHDGAIAEEGGHEDLVAAGGQYARLFEIQAANYR